MYVYVLYMINGLYASVMKYIFNRKTFYILSMRVLLFTSLKNEINIICYIIINIAINVTMLNPALSGQWTDKVIQCFRILATSFSIKSCHWLDHDTIVSMI